MALEQNSSIVYEKQHVLQDLAKNINPFLEDKAKELGMESFQMCAYAYKIFPEIPKTTLRNLIDPKFHDYRKKRDVSKDERSWTDIIKDVRHLPKDLVEGWITASQETLKPATEVLSHLDHDRRGDRNGSK